MQEQNEENWDTHQHFFNGAHNSSTWVYGFSPNKLHFGYNIPKSTDLLSILAKSKNSTRVYGLKCTSLFWSLRGNVGFNTGNIVPLAIKAREAPNNKAIKENERVLTYWNKSWPTETFQIEKLFCTNSCN